MDREFLEDRWEMMPEDRISQVLLYPRLADSELGPAITVSAADKRPCSHSSQELTQTEIEVESTTFHLYVATFSRQLGKSERIKKDWVLVDSDSKRWRVIRADLKQMQTQWHVDCTEMFGKVS